MYISKNCCKTNHKNLLLLIIFFLMLIISFCLSLILGASNVNIFSFLHDFIIGNNSSANYRIIYYVRLPRAIAAMLSGMALAVSGVVIQAVLNNSLAAPNIIGVNGGAGFFSLLIIGIFPAHYSLMPIAAIGGALFASLTIYLIAIKTGASKITITLAGIAISSIFTAGMNTIKTIFPDTLYNANSFLVGGFFGISFKNIGYTWILILLSIAFCVFLSKDIDILLLGDDTAKSLGMNITLYRFIFLVLASILAGCAVSFGGMISFVGLIIPHIMRYFVGNDHKILIPISVLGGGTFVLLCDLLSRYLFAPYEIPVGIILSFFGGPFFLFLLLSGRRG